MTKEELLQMYFFIENISGAINTVSITKNNASAPTLNLEYSYNQSEWISVTMNEDTTPNNIEIPVDGKLYLRGVNNSWCSSSSNNYYNTITATGNHNVGGNIMSLLYGSEFDGKTSFPTTNNYVLKSLFSGYTTLVNAQDLILPATTLTSGCYSNMFSNCSSLTTAPELPATILTSNCYSNMFSNCSSLTTAPELPATTLAYGCYSNMFSNCSSLTTAPALPATTLANSCYYQMFSGCKALTTTPALPATTLTDWCYRDMFQGCSSLTSCDYVIKEGTTFASNCYNNMYGNTGLIPEYVKQIDFTDEATIQSGVCIGLFSNTPVTDEYLRTVLPINEETGNIYLPVMNLANNCYERMFSVCSSLTTAPELPATTLASGCYNSMFTNSNKLTTAPELPATTLATQCYGNMFYGCRKLNYIKADFIEYSNNNNEFTSWVSNVSTTGTFVMNPNATYNVDEIRGTSGIPTNWTVTTSTES